MTDNVKGAACLNELLVLLNVALKQIIAALTGGLVKTVKIDFAAYRVYGAYHEIERLVRRNAIGSLALVERFAYFHSEPKLYAAAGGLGKLPQHLGAVVAVWIEFARVEALRIAVVREADQIETCIFRGERHFEHGVLGVG